MYKSESLNELATALSLAQGELEDASKSSKNPHFNSKYADLAEILQTIRPALSKHGLAVTQTLGAYNKADGTLQVTTILMHKSGQYIGDAVYIPVAKPDAQGIGSATTYARRYGLAAIVGIAQDDDDAEGAVRPAKAEVTTTKSKAKKATEPPPATLSEPALIEAFKTATKESMPGLAPDYASLPPEAQTRVLPFVKAARERLGL